MMGLSRTMAFLVAVLVLSMVCAYAEYVARIEEHKRIECARRRTRLIRQLREQQRRHQHATAHARQQDVIRRLESLATHTSSWADRMDVATMYATGSFPDYAPNPTLAAALYHAIAVTCDTPAIAHEARALVTTVPIRDAADISGDPLPTGPGERLLTLIATQKATTPTASGDIRTTPAPRPTTETPPPPIRNDPQNAHDHGVVASLKTTIEALPRGDGDDREAARDAVERALFEDSVDMTDETKAKALAVLHSLRDDHTHSGFGVTELEALDRVWAKIHTLSDDTKPNAIETLGKQLASAHERGVTVCSTGKIARVVGALDGISNDTTLKPVWAVRDELGSLAMQVRQRTLDSASPSERDAYARGDAPDLDETMRHEFTQQAFATYCDSLGMSKKIVTSLAQPFADAF